uniref:protein ALP1-like n=1 Tax=Erigeron canadensis TaxID=72917 RepID=UPI001CB9CA63|nr:protein ALP1-like [Erigeron canadensis]
MLGSIDCMHSGWRNCPVVWQGQYTRGDKGHPTIMLEAVASYDLWIWHAYFGPASSNNVLNESDFFDDLLQDRASKVEFSVNGEQFTKGYYLADGIYPEWATLVKSFKCPMDLKTTKFKRYQEAARKDVERAFGVLQGRWQIIEQYARPYSTNKIKWIMLCCVILHNMIVEDNGRAITKFEE